MIIQDDKKTIRAWAMYDWANSVYSLTITTAIFPIYYTAITSNGETDKVHFLGMNFINTALYSYAFSFAFLIIAIVSPLLSAISDFSGNRKSFMRFFCYLGASSCVALFFFEANTLWIGIVAFMLATIGYSGSIVFYNSYLPEISSIENQDAVSAKGFALGYIGSSLLLILNLIMIEKPMWFGLGDGTLPARFSFLLVGVWWAGFAQFTFKRLPPSVRKEPPTRNIISHGYLELAKVWRELKNQINLKKYLLAFFVYNMAVQTVMAVAVLFAGKELRLEKSELILTVLIIQFVAIAGAYFFSKFSKKKGNINSLSLAIFLWIGICIAAYFVQTSAEFYALAFCVGLVMGGIQALSRSTYSKMLPDTSHHASYFSFYDVCDKLGYFFGILLFGMIEELTGSMRNSIIALVVFFVIGLVLLRRIKKEKNLTA